MDIQAWVAAARHDPVYAVAGIGNPERFFRTLESLGLPIQRRAFPDHHEYTARDFSGFRGARIIMTEKDAVKCRHLELEDAWYLPVSARLPAAWEHAFLAELETHIRGAAHGE
jgi:tetraacyldisaccharide 4'-kinase